MYFLALEQPNGSQAQAQYPTGSISQCKTLILVLTECASMKDSYFDVLALNKGSAALEQPKLRFSSFHGTNVNAGLAECSDSAIWTAAPLVRSEMRLLKSLTHSCELCQ